MGWVRKRNRSNYLTRDIMNTSGRVYTMIVTNCYFREGTVNQSITRSCLHNPKIIVVSTDKSITESQQRIFYRETWKTCRSKTWKNCIKCLRLRNSHKINNIWALSIRSRTKEWIRNQTLKEILCNLSYRVYLLKTSILNPHIRLFLQISS